MDLFTHLTPDTTVLTPNSRLAAVIGKQHHQSQIALGKTSWPSLDILPLSSWLQRCWRNFSAQQIAIQPRLLTPEQEQITWEEILRAAAESHYLLQISSTAELAQAAWGILKQWQVDLNNPALLTTEDSVIFHGWAQRFTEICAQHNWLDTNSIANQLMQKISDKSFTPPKHLLLAGFTEITPQHEALFKTCEQAGSHITLYESPARTNTVRRICLTDQASEILTMARWAKWQYENHTAATICCVVPTLEDLRATVIETFTAVFTPKNTYTTDHTTLPFNISAGKSLTRYPVIHTALQLLQLANLNADNIPLEMISHILHSPFIADAEAEILGRAQLDAALHNDNQATVALAELGEKNAARNCPALIQHLTNYLSVLPEKKKLKKLAPLSYWLTLFMKLLNSLGWPGERTLDSAEYQTASAWLKLLTEYSSYETILEPISYSRALHYLIYLTSKKVFQPESPEARIQILGTLEAAEIPFDFLWVTGLDDTAWPHAPRPNPFIPLRLQKNLHMPHASAERELLFTQQLTQQLKHSADTVVFSHAAKSDEAELRPSPIITSIAEITVEQLDLADFTAPAQQIFASKNLEFLSDAQAAPISENETPHGGSNIFKLQAACPFKAFAELRLHARKLEALTPGLRPDKRGQIVHTALEILWLELKDQDSLLALPEAELKSLLQQCVTQAINKANIKNRNNTRFLTLEAQRLQKLLYEWLINHEMTRPHFKIKALEANHETTFANIPLRVRIDRVDELDDGKQVIIDYKTGTTNPTQDWFGERPQEPQLPLYCVLDQENTVGILFAQLNAEEMQWKGVSGAPLAIKSVKELPLEWEQQVTQWHEVLEKLGMDFYAGKAEVDPKDAAKTCEYCHLQTLCRIEENF